MRKVLTALLSAGCLAVTATFATILSASTANAQSDAWNGGWHVGGDYYYPTYYSYGAAPIYDYGFAPAYSTPGHTYGPAPLYDYGSAPAYSTTGYSYSYGSAPLYSYGVEPASGPVVIGTQIQPVQTVDTVRTVYAPQRPVVRRVHRPAEFTRSGPQQDETASNVAAPVSRATANDDYGAARARPLYNTAAAPIAQAGTASADARPAYRYVYRRDRILVIDPATNVVVQTLHR